MRSIFSAIDNFLDNGRGCKRRTRYDIYLRNALSRSGLSEDTLMLFGNDNLLLVLGENGALKNDRSTPAPTQRSFFTVVYEGWHYFSNKFARYARVGIKAASSQ